MLCETSLGAMLRDLRTHSGSPLTDLTVLSSSNDPYRLDTPANHINAAWFRDRMKDCGLLDRPNPLHNRGIHYAFVSLANVMRPDGKPYRNDEESWFFLQDKASKAARWLGYVPFDAISDARNSEPVIINADKPNPRSSIVTPKSYEDLPSEDSLRPRVWLTGFHARQHYRLAIFGEKTSLQDVLKPLARTYGADLYLPSGEISDTLIHTMAKTGAEDGREMVVFILADCDPAGYQMAVSIGHKLRALADSFFPQLRFRLVTPCLTVDQVKHIGLPSTPLKETEKRADGWRARYGVEQTEIDALLTPERSHILEQIVRDAIAPYFDAKLSWRVSSAKWDWEEAANARLDAALDTGEMADLYANVKHHLTGLTEALDEIGDAVRRVDLDLPPIELPAAIVSEPPKPLVSSEMDLHVAIRTLRQRKDYG